MDRQGTCSTCEATVEIIVRLLADFRRYLPEGQNAQDGYCYGVPLGTRVDEVLASLSLPPGAALTFLVNGRHAARDRELRDGDVLTLFPAVGGG